jgi:hypothetical protein
METLKIKIKDANGLKLIRDLEALNVLEVINPKKKKSGIKFSERLIGSISPEQAELMHKEVKKMRDEWDRDIY